MSNVSHPLNNQNDIYKSYAGIERSNAYSSRTYIDIETNRSVRPSYTRKTYTAFRQSESVPSKQKEIIKMCMEAYDNVGLIRHIIDLMGDFASQGMSIVHENKAEEKFYKRWFKEVNGQERSERFLNYLYRVGNVIVRRTTAKITPKETRRFRSYGAKESFKEPKTNKRVIPWSYEFLNPLVIDFIKESPLSNEKPKLVMNLTGRTYNSLNNNVEYLSQDLKSKIKSGKRSIPLDMNNVRAFFYKKDDWLLWANPMIRPILDDILMLEKMKLADLAALDGAISNVRLWTLGNLEHKILPKKPAVNKLRDVLASHVGGGTMDLIWGPDLTFTESSSQVYKFLGNEKYMPVLNSIYVGMGVPPALTGSSGTSGLTNNHLSLKTLIERLEYGRTILLSFWNHELKLVQKAMGFSKPPQIHFTNIILSDEAAVRKLLIDLADRNIISDETLLERFNEIPEIEKVRVGQENKVRVDRPDSVKKAGPYHNPHYPEDMAKVGLTRDVVNVKEYFDKLGIPSQKPTIIPGSPSGNNTQNKKPTDPRGGRPINTRDTNPRKQRRVIPRSNGNSMVAWALQAQKSISDIMTPIALAHFNKKNLRSLNKNQFDELEYLKLCILTGMEPYMEIDAETINLILKNKSKPSEYFINTVGAYVEEFITNCKKEPTLEDLRTIYAVVFTEINKK